MSDDRPHPVGLPRSTTITGYHIPMKDGSVMTMGMTGADDEVFIPVFSTVEKLVITMTEISISRSSNPTIISIDLIIDDIKMITDQNEFISCAMENDLKIMADPYITAEGKLRYTEILL